MIPSRLQCVAAHHLDRAIRAYQERGYEAFWLDGSPIRDSQTFLQEASRVLPLDPELSSLNWDAFTDALAGGLVGRPRSKLVVVWTNAQRMLAGNLNDLLIALDCFRDVEDELRRVGAPIDRPARLCVCLAGEGPNFPEFPPNG
jgi:hypothetical protein